MFKHPRKRKQFQPSPLQTGGAHGKLKMFDLACPLKFANECLDSGEHVEPGPQDPPVYGVKFDRKPWAFFRDREKASEFRLARIASA